MGMDAPEMEDQAGKIKYQNDKAKIRGGKAMKWIIAVCIALILFALIISGMFLFSLSVMEKAAVWAQSGIMPSSSQRFALSTSSFFRAYWPLISYIILLLCFTGTLTIAALIKRK